MRDHGCDDEAELADRRMEPIQLFVPTFRIEECLSQVRECLEKGWTGIGYKTVDLANAAVSTSGDESQHVDVDGKRYSHIVDPATGMGLTQSTAVTVIARRGIDADGLSTAVSVLGREHGEELVSSRVAELFAPATSLRAAAP